MLLAPNVHQALDGPCFSSGSDNSATSRAHAPCLVNGPDFRHGGTHKALCTCLKHKLLHHDNTKYDGYRLTNLGYDFLAINTLTKRGMLASVGRQIGVGKESDLFEVCPAPMHALPT
jgi:hypothetical protein